MNEILFIIEEDIESGYTARALGYSIFTEGETMEGLRNNIKDALECYFENKSDIPPVVRLHQVKEEFFAYA
ncbi:MAG: type II toxin-antitoxin system HicB family antitoxin [bacterium]